MPLNTINTAQLQQPALRLLADSGLLESVPELPKPIVEKLLGERYGLTGQLLRIATEKDDTFILKACDARYLVKVSSPVEARATVEMQTAAMDWLSATKAPWPVQTVLPTLDGERAVSIQDVSNRFLRVLTYLPGELLANVALDDQRLELFGIAAGRLDVGLRAFTHEGASRPFVWDLANVPILGSLKEDLTDPAQRALAAEAFDRFDANVRPKLHLLRRQVIHGDISPYNVLVQPDGASFISGIIDFGDAMDSAVIFDPAVSICNLLGKVSRDPWHASLAFLKGYLTANPLPSFEADLVAHAAIARLALRAVVAQWRARRQPDRRRYLESHAEHDWNNLSTALETPQRDVRERIKSLVD